MMAICVCTCVAVRVLYAGGRRVVNYSIRGRGFLAVGAGPSSFM